MGWKEKGPPTGTVSHGRFWDGGWHGRKFLRRSCYRYIRTTQERRHWDREWGRPKRSRQRLVDAWDEVMRWPVRSWKSHRRHQWKCR